MMIRWIKESEIDTLVELCIQHAAFEQSAYDPTGKKERLTQALFQENPSLFCLVVTQDEKLIGYATFMIQYATWEAAPYVYMDCLFLLEEARGQGIGQKLMERIKEEALERNCDLIQWQTPDFNVDAIQFYKRLGGVSKSKERFFWEIL